MRPCHCYWLRRPLARRFWLLRRKQDAKTTPVMEASWLHRRRINGRVIHLWSGRLIHKGLAQAGGRRVRRLDATALLLLLKQQ